MTKSHCHLPQSLLRDCAASVKEYAQFDFLPSDEHAGEPEAPPSSQPAQCTPVSPAPAALASAAPTDPVPQSVKGKLDRYFDSGGGSGRGEQLMHHLKSPGKRPTANDSKCSVRAWNLYKGWILRVKPSLRGLPDHRLWALDDPHPTPSADEWCGCLHFLRSSSSSYGAVSVDVSR